MMIDAPIHELELLKHFAIDPRAQSTIGKAISEINRLRSALSRFDGCPSKESLLDASCQVGIDVKPWLKQVAQGEVWSNDTR